MKKWLFAAIPLLILIVWGISLSMQKVTGEHDELAKCITENGAKMYGAYWCPHCKDQKTAFGVSWKHINYIECSTNSKGQTQECKDAKIEGYPTWEFADGSRQSGNIPLNKLAQTTGCEI